METDNRLSRAEFKMLEKMFADEIDHALRESRLPYCFQSKAKSLESLREKGLVERIDFKVGNDALAVHVEGWVLTHSGRFSYCASC